MWDLVTKLTHAQGEHLRNYKYAGADNSFIYVNITNPIYIKISEYLPMWLHPNLVTFSGLLWMIAAHLACWWYSPDFETSIPRWVHFFCGVALIVYQALDAIDGKQARRTGSSSPLGLLFDHGCDAINTLLIGFNLTTTLGTSGWPLILSYLGSTCVFYFNTLEEYYIGELVLPVFNGPNEGLWISVALHWVTAFYGDHIWKEHWVLESVPNNMIFAYFTNTVFVCTTLAHIVTITRAAMAPMSVTKHGGQGFMSAVKSVGFFLLAMIVLPLIFLYLSQELSYNVKDIARMFVWAHGFCFFKALWQLMLSHLTHVREPDHRAFVLALLFAAIHAPILHQGYMTAHEVLMEFAVVFGILYVIKALSTISEMRRVLDVYVFTLKKKK